MLVFFFFYLLDLDSNKSMKNNCIQWRPLLSVLNAIAIYLAGVIENSHLNDTNG